MKALTLHAPWAHAVAWLGKPLENRGWPPPLSIVGERIAIHAGLSESQIEWRRIDLILRTPRHAVMETSPGDLADLADGPESD
mgnify:CR=1 FL=1